MTEYYLANTDFEFELDRTNVLPLIQSMESTPILAQLQFLPCLFATASDTIVITADPGQAYRDQLLELEWFKSALDLPGLELMGKFMAPDPGDLQIWGCSSAVANWANEHGLRYSIPSIDTVRRVHSKRFTFEACPQLPGARLIHSSDQLQEWMNSLESWGVLKTCYGVAAKGHLIVKEHSKFQDLQAFCQVEWNKGLPLLAEPWVRRLLDFSSQWRLSAKKKIEHLGITTLLNDESGQYLGTEIGPQSLVQRDYAAYIDPHLEAAESLLKKVADEGYFGPLGIDAMLYASDRGKPALHPVVELNARQTMSSVALHIGRHHCPDQSLRITYTTKAHAGSALLPSQLTLSSGKSLKFRRQLFLESIPTA